MELITKHNKGIRFLLCVVYIYKKFARVNPLKDKKGITITNEFQTILEEFNWKPNQDIGR